MRDMMDSCVNGVIELIEDQVDKIKKGQHRRVKVRPKATAKNIFQIC